MRFLKLEELTTEQKLGMTYCARPNTPEDWEFVFELIEKRALGCIQVPPTRPERVKFPHLRYSQDPPCCAVRLQ